MTPFTSLEIQLIRSSLATKTDDEIAELLERPAEEVSAAVNEIGIDAGQRLADLQLYKDSQVKKAKPKNVAVKKVVKEEPQLIVKKELRKREQTRILNKQEQQRTERRKNEERRRYATRAVDYSKMKTVKVGKGIWVYVPVDVTDDMAKRKFEANRKRYERNFLSLQK